MLHGTFYHGTSSLRWERIRTEGFRLQGSLSNWLCARGLYLVRNRPIVAQFFAMAATVQDKKRVSTAHEIHPVVLKVTIDPHTEGKILDLTTDEGVKTLYQAHEDFAKTYHIGTYVELLSTLRATMPTGTTSHISDEDIKVYLHSAVKKSTSVRQPKSDCIVITDLVMRSSYAMVVATFQEGKPFTLDFFGHVYSEKYAPSYQGIRYRDSVVLCITRQDALPDLLKGCEEVQLNSTQFPAGFWDRCLAFGDAT